MGSDLNAIKDSQNNEVLIHNRLSKSGPPKLMSSTVTFIVVNLIVYLCNYRKTIARGGTLSYYVIIFLSKPDKNRSFIKL